MAPTAAMLILSHQSKTTSPSPPLQLKLPAALQWVPLSSLLVRGRFGSKSKDSEVEVDRPSSSSADSALEKRFIEALELNWW
ncbi:hypothetical protein CCACVL1_16211 [Corchorus capsularis]|uniref:Uncharacterized protein n=1 Tax=Corchorus capsularis TaxID=210143 RepID=A0A1R3HYC8_COCAP|nr:hypothetical protein CCACVL1_16211 [Corchorus capsularis]